MLNRTEPNRTGWLLRKGSTCALGGRGWVGWLWQLNVNVSSGSESASAFCWWDHLLLLNFFDLIVSKVLTFFFFPQLISAEKYFLWFKCWGRSLCFSYCLCFRFWLPLFRWFTGSACNSMARKKIREYDSKRLLKEHLKRLAHIDLQIRSTQVTLTNFSFLLIDLLWIVQMLRAQLCKVL